MHNVFYTYNTPQIGPDASDFFTILLTVLDNPAFIVLVRIVMGARSEYIF